MNGSARRPRLLTQLLFAQLVVLSVVAAVATAVAVLVGPRLFHEHLQRAGMSTSGMVLDHVEEAFTSTGVITLAASLGIAVVAAIVGTALLARQITRPLRELNVAAAEVTDGRYDRAINLTSAGPAELATVAKAFAQMATQLESAEQMRQRMLADLGHEMRTPLATLSVYLDAVDDGVAPLDAETTAVLREQVGRLERLVRDVNTVSRAQEQPLEQVELDLADVVRAAVLPLRESMPDRSVRLETGTRVLPVTGDRDRLAQVVTNLVANGLRHAGPGGQVHVCADLRDGRAVVVVNNDGDGIAADQLPHVFERFYRTDSARDRDRGGAGIGLAICQSLVGAHHGSIRAESAGVGRGARFTVDLPLRSSRELHETTRERTGDAAQAEV